MNDASLRWWHLNILTKKRHDVLLRHFSSLEEAWKQISPTFLRELHCRPDTIEQVMQKKDAIDADDMRHTMKQHDVELCMLDSDAYPLLLKQINDPPVFLSYKGDLSILNRPCVAMVGTRGMTEDGQRVVRDWTSVFTSCGLTTVSGLAYGIDTEVAKETIANDGMHAAVLACGLDDVYPAANRSLASQIIAKGGLILSEQPLGYRAEKYAFPARNRIIAGLSTATLVCEAPEGSGAVITAELAQEYGREVLAVPGSIFSPTFAGCNALIAQSQASIARMPDDVLLAMGAAAPEQPDYVFHPSSPEEEHIYRILSAVPCSVDQLVQETMLGTSAVVTTLSMLELNGAARNVGAGRWVKS